MPQEKGGPGGGPKGEERKAKLGFADAPREVTYAAPESEPDTWGTDAQLRLVGTRIPRVDGIAKATGGAVYTTDVRLPGLVHGRMFRAPRAAGTLVSLDLSAAEKAPGVLSVRALRQPGQAILMDGEDLAFLVAETEAQAEDALALCRCRIDWVQPHTTPESAMAEGARPVHADRDSNVGRGRRNPEEAAKRIAAVEEVLAKADLVLERTYRTQVQTHSALEPHGLVVRPDADGGVTVWCSTQGVASVRDGIAGALRIRGNLVRVITEFMGGGFGAKFGPSAPGSSFGAEAARAAVALSRPVRAILSRREEHLVGGNRPSSVQNVRMGLRKDGTFAGYVVRMYGTAGISEGGADAANPMIYDLGQTARDARTILTNAGPQAAFRAPGHPQGSFALEQAVDEAADALGIDPLEFRRRLDRHPIRQRQYEEGSRLFGWKERRAKRGNGSQKESLKEAQKGPLRRGAGVAAATWGQQGGTGAVVVVTVHRDGSVEVTNGSQDIGTGTRTVLAVIVAEVLGLAVGDVRVNLGRSEYPPGPGSGGSTTAPTIGPAARNAAELALRGILGDAFRGVPTAAQWKAACARMEAESQTFEGRRPEPYAGTGTYQRSVGGVQFAEVEVDEETGVVRVVKFLALQDCGRVVDRLTAESQVIGAVIGGIGYALFEERRLDPATGRMLHGDLEGYKIPGPRDIPDVEVVMTDVANGGNSVGMMGLGEAPAVPVAAAIANAVADALGVRVREIPMTPARVLAAIAEQRAAGPAKSESGPSKDGSGNGTDGSSGPGKKEGR